MRARIFSITTLLLILLAANLAAAIDISSLNHEDQMKAMLDAYQQKFGLAKSSAGGAGMDGGIMRKCGLPLALQLGALVAQYGTIAGFENVLARPTNLTQILDSPGGHFKIHYSTTDPEDRIDTRYGDQNGNLIPDYPEIVARIADSVWVHHVDELGYIPPIDDADYGGGDSRYDIFVKDVGANVYGSTVPDVAVRPAQMVQVTSWMELDTKYQDYFGYADKPIEALQVTIAHEFFHALHLTYDGQEPCTDAACTASKQNPYWLEMSAVWMEEETYDDVNDYYNYIPFYLKTIHQPPYKISQDGLNIYGAGLLPIFLAEKYGKEIIRLAWENCGSQPLENFFSGAVQTALDQQTNGEVNLEEAWTEYSRWLFFTGARARTGRYYSEGANYAMVPDSLANPLRPYIRYYTEYPITLTQSADNQFLPGELGINYLVFRTGSLDTGFAMDFVGVASSNPSTEWRKSVIAYDRFNSNGQFRVHESLYPLNSAVLEEDLDGITDLLVIPTIVNPELKRANNSYRFAVADTSVFIAENRVLFANTKFELAKVLDKPFTVIFDVSERLNADISIFTAAGERVYQSRIESVDPGDPRSFTWTGKNDDNEEVASGVYIVQARIGDEIRHQKILLIR